MCVCVCGCSFAYDIEVHYATTKTKTRRRRSQCNDPLKNGCRKQKAEYRYIVSKRFWRSIELYDIWYKRNNHFRFIRQLETVWQIFHAIFFVFSVLFFLLHEKNLYFFFLSSLSSEFHTDIRYIHTFLQLVKIYIYVYVFTQFFVWQKV